MERSSEERAEIYEEEKVRIEAQKKARKKFNWKDYHLLIVLGIAAAIILVWVSTRSCGRYIEPNEVNPMSSLRAIVLYSTDANTFEIVNDDDFDWANVLLTVNMRYSYKIYRMRRSTARIIIAVDFIDIYGDLSRFDPSIEKPFNFMITCDIPPGLRFQTDAARLGYGFWAAALK